MCAPQKKKGEGENQMAKTLTHSKKLVALLLAVALMLSVCVVPNASAAAGTTATAAAPAYTGSFTNTSDDGKDWISLTAERTFKVTIPVDMTEDEAKAIADDVVWTLDYDEDAGYLDTKLYPNHTEGGEISGWLNENDEPLFKNIATTVETTEDGKVNIVLTFSNSIYFWASNWYTGETYEDASAPHANGGYYLDICGWYYVTASVDGKDLGSAYTKINPYDNFHTMKEIYSDIDAIVDYAKKNTNIYVEKFSMGKSAGKNGLESLDMPYLIIAKNKAATEKWLDIADKAETDPQSLIDSIKDGSIGDYQVPVLYSNVHSNEVAASDGVLGFAWMLVENAAVDTPIDYKELTGFTAEGEAELAKQLGPKGEEGSIAIPDLVADKATYLGFIKNGSISQKVDLEKYYTIEDKDVSTEELLEDVFFIIVPEENVEGRTYVTRHSSGGYDLNRDNSFQTQAETQNMTKLIATWNPVSFAEFHGRIEQFQVEPCDPPHEPNFEYDLLADHLVTGGEALGIGAVANNDGHNSYVTPQRDYLSYTGETNADGTYKTEWYDPWDDMSTSYTPQYSMLHGTVAYTVEVPAYDDYMATALPYGMLNQSVYIAGEKDSYLTDQATIYLRGVTNANSDKEVGPWFTDRFDVEGAEATLFRPEYTGEGENGNFFPEAYIIPVDGTNQKNLQDAAEMIDYLIHNDVKVMKASESFTYDGVTYPAGTAVVSMYQAKRSVANGVLYNGTVITEWPVLYSEGITAFNHTRGFDMATVTKPADYTEIAKVCAVSTDWDVKSSFIGDKDGTIILLNTSEDAAKAVNTLLKAGKTVKLITDGKYDGSFIVSYADYESFSEDLTISAVSVAEEPASKTINAAPVIYITGKPADNTEGFVKTSLISSVTGYNYDREAMDLLGFTTTDDPAKADVIIGASRPDAAAVEAIKSGVPYIGYGSSVASTVASLFTEGAVVRNSVSRSAMDALAHVTYPEKNSPVTATYIAEGDDIMYGYGAGYFESIPAGAKTLVKLDGSQKLLEGFLPSDGAHYNDFLNDSVQAFSYEGKGADGSDLDIAVFANTLTNKVHQRDEFTFIVNFAFDAMTSDPTDKVTRGEAVEAIWAANGSEKAATSAAFTDAATYGWVTDAINWAAAENIVLGYPNGGFSAKTFVTREEFVTMLWRANGGKEADKAALDVFTDAADINGYAKDAMAWAVSEGYVKGTTATTISPDAAITFEQVQTIIARIDAE